MKHLQIHPHTMEILAYGDAFGLPYETRTKQEIYDLGGVTPCIIAPYTHSDFDDFIGMPAGTWSDDTQHALAVAETLEKVGMYSLKHIALALQEEMSHAKGWGKTTKRAIGRVHAEMTVDELRANGETQGNGCGPLMRSVPLTIFALATKPQLLEQMAYDSAGLTHNNVENIAAIVTHHQVLAHLVQNRSDIAPLRDIAYRLACKNETIYGATPHLSDAIQRASIVEDIAGHVYESTKWGAFTTWAVQAVSYEVFTRSVGKGLLDMLVDVVSEGGDADSTGALVAGMWALSRTEGTLPQDINILEDSSRLRRSSSYLTSLLG